MNGDRIKGTAYRCLILWLLAIVVTVASAVYQRKTGPTQPYRGEYMADGRVWTYRLTRNPTTNAPLEVRIQGPENYSAQLVWREYPTDRDWKTVQMTRKAPVFETVVPVQPTAGKVEFFIKLSDSGGHGSIEIPGAGHRIIARYKHPVPAWALIPHILLMFTAMLVSNRAGLGILFKEPARRNLIWITFLTLTTGGLVFGPIVQQYAFGAAWTGWPVGNDLTDNKIAVAFLAWLVPVAGRLRKKDWRISILIASLVMLTVYMIPHSLMGSEHVYSAEDETVTALFSNG